MKILVLGSGTATRHPDRGPLAWWADGEPSCTSTRTHSAIAVSDDGDRWVLLNASSDIGQQLRNSPPLHPRADGSSPIQAVVLMDAHIDHVAGLLSLRDGPPLNVYATPSVFEDLTSGLPLLNVLESYCGIRWQVLPVAGDQPSTAFQVPSLPALRFVALAVPGHPPPYSHQGPDEQLGAHIAVMVEDVRNGQRLFYAPGPVPSEGPVQEHMRNADSLLIDGSGWPAPEQRGGLPPAARHKVLIHVHPSANPSGPSVPDAATAEVELAWDGMEIVL